MWSLVDQFYHNLSLNLGWNDEDNLLVIRGFRIWYLWHWRNNSIFDESFTRLSKMEKVVWATGEELGKAEDMIYQIGEKKKREVVGTAQNPPLVDWIKLNFDGIAKKNPKVVGCEVYAKEQMANGFQVLCVIWENVIPLWLSYGGALYTLKMAWELGHKMVIIEFDSKALVDIERVCWLREG